MIRWLRNQWALFTGKAVRCCQCRRIVRNYTSGGDWGGPWNICFPCNDADNRRWAEEDKRHKIESAARRIIVPLLALLLSLAGCSATKRISNAAREVVTLAHDASGELDAAVATGEVGERAMPHVEKAQHNLGAIAAKGEEVVEVVNSGAVKDSRPLWWLPWAIVLAPITFLVWRFWPVIQIGIAWVVALFGGTPKATKAQAQADLAWEADPTPVDATDVPLVKAMAVREATDPAYRVAKARAKGGK